MALPLLDAMIPARTALAATAATPTPHMGFIYFPHGAIMEHWTPKTEGATFDLPHHSETARAIPEAADRRERPGKQARHQPGGTRHHTGNMAELRTSARQPGSFLRPTVDQIAAAHIGQDTPLPSLEVAIEGRGGGGSCDRDFGCSYSGTISFRTPTTPLPMETEPRKVFQSLFGQGDTADERKVLGKQYASILDLVSTEATDLQRTLGPADRAMLSDYLDTVREIERRIQKMEAHDLSHVDIPNAPAGTPPQFEQHMI